LNKVSLNPLDVLSENILSKCQGTEFWRNMNNMDGLESAPAEEAKYLDEFEKNSTPNNETLIG